MHSHPGVRGAKETRWSFCISRNSMTLMVTRLGNSRIPRPSGYKGQGQIRGDLQRGGSVYPYGTPPALSSINLLFYLPRSSSRREPTKPELLNLTKPSEITYHDVGHTPVLYRSLLSCSLLARSRNLRLLSPYQHIVLHIPRVLPRLARS